MMAAIIIYILISVVVLNLMTRTERSELGSTRRISIHLSQKTHFRKQPKYQYEPTKTDWTADVLCSADDTVVAIPEMLKTASIPLWCCF